jgi:hypothetical protein
VNFGGLFNLAAGITAIAFGLYSPKFEPMGITTAWVFKNRNVPSWPFRLFYVGLGMVLMYAGFERLG